MRRAFKGVWIPVEIWNMEIDGKGLNPTLTCILAEIDSLSSKGMPCFARNSHFEKLFNISKPTVSRSISWLHAKGLVRMCYNEAGGRELYSNIAYHFDKPNQIDKGANHFDKGANQIDKGGNQFDKHRIQLDNNKKTISDISSFEDKLSKSKNFKLISFLNSTMANYDVFVAELQKAGHADLNYEKLYSRVKVWASDGRKRKNWLRVVLTFVSNDHGGGKIFYNKNFTENGTKNINEELSRRIAKGLRGKG